MKQISLVFLALIFFLPMHTHSATEDKILRIGADPWCPYNCASSDKNKGYLVDIAVQVYESQGYKVVYGNLPWRRAFLEINTNHLDAVIGVVEGNKENLLLNKMPLGIDETVIVVRKNEMFTYSGPQSLQSKQIGVITNYTYDNNGELDTFLNQLKSSNPSSINVLFHEDALNSLYFMLLDKRIDLFLENRVIARYTAQQQGLLNKVDFIDTSASDNIYFGFKNNEKGRALANMLDEGIKKMMANGQLDELKLLYGLK